MAAEDDPGSFGALLRRHRLACGLSQEELAERAGLSRRGISDLERGARRTPHPATLRRLAEALNLVAQDHASLLASLQRAEKSRNIVTSREAPALRLGQSKRAELETAAIRPGAPPDRDAERVQLRAQSAPNRDQNLPAQLTSFVGRVQETADIRCQLAKTRLLTLTGPGGVGKTRLALRVARDELSRFEDGVWFVELASIIEPTLIPQAVASLFSLRENPEESLQTSLARFLERRHLLLILDNCEHVLAACVDLVHRILRACPHVVILATSREVLGLAAETIWRVPSMQLPDLDLARDPIEVAQSEAVALFIERARSVQPGFAVTLRNGPALVELCQRVDGIPLAIELAASRVGVLGLEQIAQRLAGRFRLLASHDPTVEPRQQTLERTIRWSYDLLTAAERSLFDRLSVFTGGWSLDAMEAVAGGPTTGSGDELIDVLHRLIDKSLVLVYQPDEGQIRYRLLEPVRQFAHDRLVEMGDLHSTQQRHAAFFTAWFEEEDAAIRVGKGPAPGWLNRADLEQENLRVALRWLIGQKDAEGAQRVAGASRPFWQTRGYLAEGRRWLEEALALDPIDNVADQTAAPSSPAFSAVCSASEAERSRLSARAKALMALGHLAQYQGDLALAEEASIRSLRLYRRLVDRDGAGWPLATLARAAAMRGNLDRARDFLEQVLAVNLENDRPTLVCANLHQLAELDLEQGRYAEAQQRAEESLRIAEVEGVTTLICYASTVLGELHYRLGRSETARSLWEHGLARVRTSHVKTHYMIRPLLKLGRLACELGEMGRAGPFLGEAVKLAEEMSRFELARSLECMFELAVSHGEAESALQLAGTAAAMRDAMGAPPWPTERARLDSVISRARQTLSEISADAAWMRGWMTPANKAVALALDLLQDLPAGPRAWSSSTRIVTAATSRL